MHRASKVGVLGCSSTAGTETTLAITGVPRLLDTFETAFAGLPLFSCAFVDTLFAVVTLFRVLGIVTSAF